MKVLDFIQNPIITEDEYIFELDKIAKKTIADSKCLSGAFAYLDNLDEERKIEIMKNWDKATWIRFSMQNTVSEHDVFDPIIKLIEEDNN